jgi:hypothetical protein
MDVSCFNLASRTGSDPTYSPFPVQSSPVLSLSLHAAEGHRHDTNHFSPIAAASASDLSFATMNR